MLEYAGKSYVTWAQALREYWEQQITWKDVMEEKTWDGPRQDTKDLKLSLYL